MRWIRIPYNQGKNAYLSIRTSVSIFSLFALMLWIEMEICFWKTMKSWNDMKDG